MKEATEHSHNLVAIVYSLSHVFFGRFVLVGVFLSSFSRQEATRFEVGPPFHHHNSLRYSFSMLPFLRLACSLYFFRTIYITFCFPVSIRLREVYLLILPKMILLSSTYYRGKIHSFIPFICLNCFRLYFVLSFRIHVGPAAVRMLTTADQVAYHAKFQQLKRSLSWNLWNYQYRSYLLCYGYQNFSNFGSNTSRCSLETTAWILSFHVSYR